MKVSLKVTLSTSLSFLKLQKSVNEIIVWFHMEKHFDYPIRPNLVRRGHCTHMMWYCNFLNILHCRIIKGGPLRQKEPCLTMFSLQNIFYNKHLMIFGCLPVNEKEYILFEEFSTYKWIACRMSNICKSSLLTLSALKNVGVVDHSLISMLEVSSKCWLEAKARPIL